MSRSELNQRYAGIVQGVLYGLAEGRKENAELEEENKKLKEKLEKVQNYLAYEIPHDLMNEATKKIYEMV